MFELFKAIGLGLMVLLPLVNPLTTVALFLSLSKNMTVEERNQQARLASVYVFAIMMVAFYAGTLVMNTFGISIPGLRIAGGLSSPLSVFACCFPHRPMMTPVSPKVRRAKCISIKPPISPLCRWRVRLSRVLSP